MSTNTQTYNCLQGHVLSSVIVPGGPTASQHETNSRDQKRQEGGPAESPQRWETTGAMDACPWEDEAGKQTVTLCDFGG